MHEINPSPRASLLSPPKRRKPLKLQNMLPLFLPSLLFAFFRADDCSQSYFLYACVDEVDLKISSLVQRCDVSILSHRKIVGSESDKNHFLLEFFVL